LYLAVSYQQRGEAAAAHRHLQIALQLSTTADQRQHFREWFRQQTRPAHP
jgi:hypothetical protein